MPKAVADAPPPAVSSSSVTTTTDSQCPQIYPALVEVAADLSRLGVSKSRVNEQQHFKFRGIDDVMNAVSAILPKHHVVFLPRYEDHATTDRPTKDGRGSLIYATVRGEFTFVSAIDGSDVQVSTFGEAMDSGDKALNKAMSVSLKYALLQTFLIPTESNEDADASTPAETLPPPPAGFANWFATWLAAADDGLNHLAAGWRAAPEVYRDYATQYCADQRAEARGRATKATAAAVAAAKPAETTEPEGQ